MSFLRFDSAQNAAGALGYSLHDQAASTGAWEVAVAPLGETTRALITGSDVIIYVQQGDMMIRLTVAAPVGDPTPTAAVIMQAMLAQAS